MRHRLPKPWTQGPIESCTAHAVAAALYLLHHVQPSRLALYWAARALRRKIPFDSGAMLHHAVKAAQRYGVVAEKRWPYRPAKASRATLRFPGFSPPVRRPPVGHRLGIQPRRLPRDLDMMKACLAQGHPIVFGLWVHSSFWDAAGRPQSVIPVPRKGERRRGGHAVVAIGYDDAKGAFLIRNSWGEHVQEGGHFWLPYCFMLEPRLATDFWILLK